jgi:hypothetical protein
MHGSEAEIQRTQHAPSNRSFGATLTGSAASSSVTICCWHGARNQGTLLLGIDKDTKSAYLYAVGHANGTATVIQGLGKVPGTFNDPVYFR